MIATGLPCPICGAQLGAPTIHAPDRLHGTGGTHQVARCGVCGAGVTLPRVSDEELEAFYPDEYGPYSERMSPLERVASRMIRAWQGRSAMRAPRSRCCATASLAAGSMSAAAGATSPRHSSLAAGP